MQSQITNKETTAIKAIRNFLMQNGRMPSVRELMRDLEYKSPRSVSVILNNLIEKGVLNKKDDGSIQLIQDHTVNSDAEREETTQIPLLGLVTCGSPMLAEENIEAYFSVSTKLAKQPGKYYFLRAMGDSMNQKGIYDGDLVLIKQQSTANNGDIIVALIDDEATIKELQINPDSVVLHPRSSNKKHTPIILSRDLIIQGIVVTTIPGI